jgi:DNA-binding CsgD family transcriptional regulator
VPLTLSDQELKRLSAAQIALLSPLSFPTVDAWRGAACESLKHLVEGDQAVFLLWHQDQPWNPIYSQEITPKEELLMVELAPEQKDAQERISKLGCAYSQTELIAGDWEGYRRDRAVNEVLLPYGRRDAVGFLHPGSDPAGGFLTNINIYKKRYGTELFGEKGSLLMHLLAPAFAAGVTLVRRRADAAGSLLRMLEGAGARAWLVDGSGSITHEGDGIRTLLADDAEASRVRARASRLGLDLWVSVAGRQAASPGDTAFQVLTHRRTYMLRAALAGDTYLAEASTVLVMLEADPSPGVSDAQLRERFGLTAREVEIARLIARGQSTRDIAGRLGISTHTLRRHVERVLSKLGVHSRAAVGAQLHPRLP